MIREAFRLLWETDHLLRTDEAHDLTLEQFDHDGDVPEYWPTESGQTALPDLVVMTAGFGDVTYTDYPSNDRDWPVMSKKMLAILLGVAEFGHQTVPVSIVDPVVRTEQEHEQAGALLETRWPDANREYVIVQLTDPVELDEEASGVARDPNLPWIVDVHQYVFKQPASTLPPIFRLSIDPTVLYISATARVALKAAGIAGPRYLPLEGYVDGGGDEVDIQVPEPNVSD